ncbi:MAG: metal-dependent hydrolase [Prosthecobacter sp.]
MNRRHFLGHTAAFAAAPLLAAEKQTGIIDCNLHLGRHPNRDLPQIDSAFLSKHHIDQAWAGSFEALLHRDIAVVNQRLADACKHEPRLWPAGSIHLLLPAWKDDFKRCVETHDMKILRLHPNHHGYTLEDPNFTELLELAAERMIVQIVTQLEDQRTQHPLTQVAPVDLKPLTEVLKRVPNARVMLLNANAAMVTKTLQGSTNLWLDMAMIEGVGGVENLLKSWPAEKLCFGSHAPFFYWESSALKLQESVLTSEQLVAVQRGNALALL